MMETEKRRKTRHDLDRDDGLPLFPKDVGLSVLPEATAAWAQVATKARFLLLQYAQTREGLIPAQSRLIEETLKDLSESIDRAGDKDV